jgi:ribonuclease P protein component
MDRRLRLRSEADYRHIRAQGHSWGSRYLTLLVLPNGTAHNRYGIIVSKRVGNAVTRNLVKRRLRELLRRLDREGCIAAGHDLVLIGRPVLASATFAEFTSAVRGLLDRSALLQEPTPPLDAPAASATTLSQDEPG